MQEPAPKGIKITSPVMVDRQHLETEQKITESLKQAGVKNASQGVSADHSNVLKDIEKIGGEVLHDTQAFLDTTKEEIGGGATYIRTAKPGSIQSIIQEKRRKGGRIVSMLNKLGFKKAA